MRERREKIAVDSDSFSQGQRTGEKGDGERRRGLAGRRHSQTMDEEDERYGIPPLDLLEGARTQVG